eukprot:14094-Heterococcus_DN1.PRE.1
MSRIALQDLYGIRVCRLCDAKDTTRSTAVTLTVVRHCLYVCNRRRAEKRDSFYHLQRTMERRTEETRLIRERAEERKVTLAAAAPGNARYH